MRLYKYLLLLSTIFIFSYLTISCTKTYTPEELKANLEIYLDKNCTIKWDYNNKPDLSNVKWRDSGSLWQYTDLVVYLRNLNEIPVKVFINSSREMMILGGEYIPKYYPIGFSVSCDDIILDTNETKEVTISIGQNPYADSYDSNVYFHIYPLEQ